MFLPGTSASLVFYPPFNFLSFPNPLYIIVARIHGLSEYTHLCLSCGLVLCALQPPHRPWPHCTTPLLTPPVRAALIAQLEELCPFTLKEAEAREREAEGLRLAEGAFPALLSSGSGRGGATVGVRGGGREEGREVVVMAVVVDWVIVCFWWIRKTKRVRVESYLRSGEEEEEEDAAGIDGTLSTLQRVPPPPREIEYSKRPIVALFEVVPVSE